MRLRRETTCQMHGHDRHRCAIHACRGEQLLLRMSTRIAVVQMGQKPCYGSSHPVTIRAHGNSRPASDHLAMPDKRIDYDFPVHLYRQALRPPAFRRCGRCALASTVGALRAPIGLTQPAEIELATPRCLAGLTWTTAPEALRRRFRDVTGYDDSSSHPRMTTP